MRWRVVLSRYAERDLEAIRDWTREAFGARQADVYLSGVALAVKRLADGPLALGTSARDEVGPGFRVLHMSRCGAIGRHLLLFRAGEGDIVEVLRVLHDAMDLPRHVPPPGLQEDPAPFAP